MSSVLVLGIDPRAIPGFADAETVVSALDQELSRFDGQGIAASMALIRLDDSVESAMVAALTERVWDVVVVGGGIRKPEPLLMLFEQVINLIRQYAPQAAIAFNTSGGDSVEAAQRWL